MYTAYIDCITPVSPVAILLFFGNVDAVTEFDQRIVIVDGWIGYSSIPSYTLLIIQLLLELQHRILFSGRCWLSSKD